MAANAESKKVFGIIVCDHEAKWGGAGGIAKRLQVFLEEDGEDWRVFYAEQGQFPSESELKDFQGIYIPGSKHSVNDDYIWIRKLEELIQQAYVLRTPNIFGACFGHQVIGKALGGRVARNPSKKFACCSEEIVLKLKDTLSDFMFCKAIEKLSENKPLCVLESHGECVVELPKNAQSVASSASCDHEIVVYSGNIIGVQSHPDFIIEDLSDIILPSLLQRNIITKEEYEAAKYSLNIPNISQDVLRAVRDFLKS